MKGKWERSVAKNVKKKSVKIRKNRLNREELKGRINVCVMMGSGELREKLKEGYENEERKIKKKYHLKV